MGTAMLLSTFIAGMGKTRDILTALIALHTVTKMAD